MGPTGRRVLIVEDNVDSAEALCVLLQFWGYDITVAMSAPEALAGVRARRPDAVVLDLGLPTLRHGCALLTQIRALPRGDEIVLIAVTGHAMASDRRLAMAAGCDVFFAKPADLDDLKAALDAIDTHRAWIANGRPK